MKKIETYELLIELNAKETSIKALKVFSELSKGRQHAFMALLCIRAFLFIPGKKSVVDQILQHKKQHVFTSGHLTGCGSAELHPTVKSAS